MAGDVAIGWVIVVQLAFVWAVIVKSPTGRSATVVVVVITTEGVAVDQSVAFNTDRGRGVAADVDTGRPGGLLQARAVIGMRVAAVDVAIGRRSVACRRRFKE